MNPSKDLGIPLIPTPEHNPMFLGLPTPSAATSSRFGVNMRLMLMVGLALLALAAAPADMVAQGSPSLSIAPGHETLTAAAQLRLPATELSVLERPGQLAVQRARGNKRQGEIMMIVGAAGIVTGLLTHEDLITIAGAVVGGVGLYFYLQATR